MRAYLLQATQNGTQSWLTPDIILYFAITFVILVGVFIFRQEFWEAGMALARWLRERKRTTDQPVGIPSANESARPKDARRGPNAPRNDYTLDSVRPTDQDAGRQAAPQPVRPTPPQPMKDPQPSASSNPAGELEKTFAQFGQRMDAMIAQNNEYLRQVKLAEKEKNDATIESRKAVQALEEQLRARNAQIAELDALLDRKSMIPGLKALIEVRKLCIDMLGTQKPLAHDDLIRFVTDDIDSKLQDLDIRTIEYPEGTPLEKIPGEQIEVAQRHEPTEDPARHNQVFKMTRPCYYFERDSKRNIVAKASITLYRYVPSRPASTPSA